MNNPSQNQYIELSASEIFPIHFDTGDKHFLPLHDFIATAQSISDIVYDLRNGIVDKNFAIQVLVLPPEDGTFLTKLKIVVKILAGVGFVIGTTSETAQLLDSDVGKNALEEATGLTPADLGKNLGKSIKHISQLPQRLMKDITQKPQAVQEDLENQLRDLTSATKTFIAAPSSSDIIKFYPEQHHKKAYIARNRFFSTCMLNNTIQGVGFEEIDNFPIERKDFGEFIVSLSDTKTVQRSKNWENETKKVLVVSPVWSKVDRRWVVMSDGKEAYLKIEDPNFWDYVLANTLTKVIKDEMTVQWVKPIHSGRQNRIVLRVLEFNGQKISDPMTSEQVEVWAEVHNVTAMINLDDVASPPQQQEFQF